MLAHKAINKTVMDSCAETTTGNTLLTNIKSNTTWYNLPFAKKSPIWGT